MNWIKCVPFVGTAISACECIGAVVRGDVRGALWKLGETVVDGALDATIVMSGGLAAIVTTPGKIAGKTAGKAVVSVAAKAVGGRVLAGAVASSIADKKQNHFASWSIFETIYYDSTRDSESEESHGDTARKSGQTQGNKHQSSTSGQTSDKKKQSSAARDNNKSSMNHPNQNTNYDNYYGSDDEEDEEKRKKALLSGCAADIPRPRRQRRSSRLPRLGSIDDQCSPALPRANNVQMANERVVGHMIDYIESRSNDGLPNEAIDFIFETLLTSRPLNEFYQLHQDYLVVQVDEVFSGSTGGGERWKIDFTIDIDPRVGRQDAHVGRQDAHVGYTIDRILNLRGITVPREIGHVYLPNNMEVIGRPPLALQDSHLTKILVRKIEKGKMIRECYVTFLKRHPR